MNTDQKNNKDLLPDDPVLLKQMLLEQEEIILQNKSIIEQLQSENSDLREEINLMIAQRFGKRSERHDHSAQLNLFNEPEVILQNEEDTEETEEDNVSEEVETRPRKKRGCRQPLPSFFERDVTVIDIPENEKTCPHDGSSLVEIGRDVSERLEIIPAKIRVRQTVRIKYGCPACEDVIKQSPPPPAMIPKGIASASLLAYIATSKYVDGLPLYRQEAQFQRIGVDLSRASAARWMIQVSTLIQPCIHLLREELLRAEIIHMDETTVQVNKESGRKAETKSYMWVQRTGEHAKDIVLYHYDPGRSSKTALELLDGFKGYVHTDGYLAYPLAIRKLGDIQEQDHKELIDPGNDILLVGCWAHARRKFDEVLKATNKKGGKAGKMISLIKQLYMIDREVREMPPEQQTKARQERCGPVMNEIRKFVDEHDASSPPHSKLGKALLYVKNNWTCLTRFLIDARLRLDNNRIESSIRPFVIGRKNWLFADTPAGAQASANLYSMIETAKANQLEPWAYLNYLFEKLPAALEKSDSTEELTRLLPTHVTPEMLIQH